MPHNQAATLPAVESKHRYVLAIYLLCAVFLFLITLIPYETSIPYLSSSYPISRLVVSLMYGGWVAAIVHASFFCVWCHPVVTGEERVPKRSAFALIAMTVFTVLHFIRDWNEGIEHQGEEVVVFWAWINGGFILILAALWVWARKRGGLTLYFFFHTLMFAWLGLAFLPFFGRWS